jgi:4-hydroxy-tetrahydrodipicolinate reductase
MGEGIRILVLGTGQMGSRIARLVLDKAGLDLVGAYARRAERGGKDLGPLIGLGKNLSIPVSNDLTAVIRQTTPQLAIQATCSRLSEAWGEISVLLEHGVNVISIAEEMAYPASSSPAVAEDLHRLAIEHGVSLLGTGINPGFILDLLVIALTGVCAEIHSITAERINDLAGYGPTVLKNQGVGLTPDEFRRGVEQGRVVGHLGFRESITMIGATLGWRIDRIDETREPILAHVRCVTPHVTVEPGQVAGCHHTAVAFSGDRPVIILIHPQQIHPMLQGMQTGDRIEIEGTPNITLAGSPEIPGDIATPALTVNMIPRVLNAPPGLYCMADLPVPSAMLGDARQLIRGVST